MKNIVILIALLIGVKGYSQVAINADNSAPDPSAMLDVKSTDRGMLVPRMTSAQRTAIASPVSGLLVFDNDTQSFWFCSSGSWLELTDQSSQQWTYNGSNIHYSSGNVGVGDASPAATLSVGNGDKFQVSGAQGDVTFTDDEASIQFPATAIPNSPMIYMFGGGTQNADRMVLSHSLTYPKWGIEYRDTNDVFYMRNASERRFTFNLATGRMGVGTPEPQARLDVNGDALVNGITVGIGSGNLSTNTVFGRTAFISNISGSGNTAIGEGALIYNNTGDNNIAIGPGSLTYNNSGSNNTAVGAYSLAFGSTAQNNTSFGSYAGNGPNHGNNNTFIGAFSSASANNLFNTTGLGYNATPDASNKVRIGNNSVTSIGGQVGWSTFSDGRYKRDIEENIPGLAFVNRLRPVSYTVDISGLDNHYPKPALREGQKTAEVTDVSSQEKIRYSGFIAQEVETAANELNFTFSGIDKPVKEGNLYGIRYADFVVPLVKAVQELSNMVEMQQREIGELRAIIESNQSR
ncbi:MAG: tail fiber domain-containing protein [Lentimicrobium sp.]